MRRELQILQWSVAGVIIMMSLLCLRTIRRRRLQNNGRTASTTGTQPEAPVSVQSSPPEPPVLPPRGEAAASFVPVSDAAPPPSGQTARYRRHVDGTFSVPHVVVPPQKAISYCLLPTLSPCISPVWSSVITQMDSENRIHIPEISRAPTNGTSVVGKIATTARMMCLRVLMVGVTPCLDRVLHAIPVFDALPTVSPSVDIFHVDPSHSEDSVERCVRKNV